MSSKTPEVTPEKNRIYAKGSPERFQIQAALENFKKSLPYTISGVLGEIDRAPKVLHVNPSEHAITISSISTIPESLLSQAIKNSLKAKDAWESLPFSERAAVLLRCADLVAAKFRYQMIAALILGQGMDIRQSELDVSNLIDSLRFNVQNAERLYSQQPLFNAPGTWNSLEYAPLPGFIYVKTSSYSLAESGNLVNAPIMMGNAIIWTMPSEAALPNYILLQALREAGLHPDIIQFIPGASISIAEGIVASPNLSAIAFSGSLVHFLNLQLQVHAGMVSRTYKTIPRIIAEITSNNLHIVHPICDLDKAVSNTIRGAFEFQGQKSTSTSSIYIPSSLWDVFQIRLISSTESLFVGPTDVFKNFVGPVINKAAMERLVDIVKAAEEDNSLELISGGKYDDATGYFIYPTIFVTKNQSHPLLSPKEPIQGPILVVCIYDNDIIPSEEAWLSICKAIKSRISLIQSVSIFASDRQAILAAKNVFKGVIGNFCINTQCNAAQMTHNPSGGGQVSSTGEKKGTVAFLERFVNTSSVKEELVGGYHVIYASNVE